MPVYKQMTKQKWKNQIKKACESAKTYQPFFDSVIDSLAGIMALRDQAEEKYLASGGNPVIVHTNKNGVANIVKNPALVVVMECNATALTYWKELGLTSRAYKSMAGSLVPDDGGKRLEDILSDLGV